MGALLLPGRDCPPQTKYPRTPTLSPRPAHICIKGLLSCPGRESALTRWTLSPVLARCRRTDETLSCKCTVLYTVVSTSPK